MRNPEYKLKTAGKKSQITGVRQILWILLKSDAIKRWEGEAEDEAGIRMCYVRVPTPHKDVIITCLDP